jgi:hypothetical protein
MLLVYQWWFDGRMISYVDSYEGKRKRKRKKGRWWRIDKRKRQRQNKKANHYLFFESTVSMYKISTFFFFYLLHLLSLFVLFSTIITIILFKLRYIFLLPISNDNVSVHSTYFQILFGFVFLCSATKEM